MINCQLYVWIAHLCVGPLVAKCVAVLASQLNRSDACPSQRVAMHAEPGPTATQPQQSFDRP
jgi:hypothetical protein